MTSRFLGLLAGALVVLAMAAGAAGAAGPAQVTFRAEGDATTLVPKTTLTTTTTPVNKDGKHTCSGTSAAGALEQGTQGQWNGPYFNGLGYSVDVIEGERHTFSDPEYWTLWVNDKSSQTGLCDTELQAGDDVLFFPCDPDPQTFDCRNTPLELRAPASVETGGSFTVSVVQFDKDGASQPAGQVAVAGSGLSATTGPDGRATLTAPPDPGTIALRGSKTGAVRSATVSVAVTAAGWPPPPGGGTPPPAADRTPPTFAFTAITDNAVFATGHGPRTLRGAAGQDPSGLQDVRIRLVRRTKTRCYVYDNRVERFRQRTCRLNGRGYFSVGDRAAFSFLLPERLGRGRYILDAHALDKAGNLSPLARGTSRIAFSVR